jgi:NTE family protein
VTRVGLVLGGGGVVGQAYHAGALTALEHDLGWDARTADVIVGTSAGALTGAALRVGLPSSALAAWCVDAPLWGLAADVAPLIGSRRVFDPFVISSILRPGRLPGVELVRQTVRAPWRLRPLTALLTLLRDGARDIESEVEALSLLGDGWPAHDLWVCAVERERARRVVFGRDGAPAAALHTAVASSCAVPGYFAPVVIDGRHYIDGGARSATNLDVLARRPLDVVVAVAPMSAAEPRPGPDGWLRAMVRRSLRQEARLISRDCPVLFIEPDPTVVDAMGRDVMDHSRVTDVVRESFLATGAQLRRTEHGTVGLLERRAARGRIA